ncbi:surface protease GP63 [Trypanosoma cruzi]|nr:surface protease GP63 [Trypanosoma cruzi]
MHIAVDLNASFAVHAGSCVWRLLYSSVAMRRREEGVRSPSLFSCGCDAPRVTALSWALCPIEGGMAGNFVAASWIAEGPLARVAGVVGARSVCVVWWPRAFGISRWLCE